jgi:hypothetical protein
LRYRTERRCGRQRLGPKEFGLGGSIRQACSSRPALSGESSTRSEKAFANYTAASERLLAPSASAQTLRKEDAWNGLECSLSAAQ